MKKLVILTVYENLEIPLSYRDVPKKGRRSFVCDGVRSTRIQAQLGRSSVNTIEIAQGLQPGDRMTVSAMSQWDAHGRITLD
jgi:hypothetical protein